LLLRGSLSPSARTAATEMTYAVDVLEARGELDPDSRRPRPTSRAT
jgi:hypothetical protein